MYKRQHIKVSDHSSSSRSGGNTEMNRAGETDKIEKFEKIPEEQEMPIDFLKKQVEKADRSRYDICEIFSPPRVCVVATDHGLKGGWSLDVNTRDPVTGKCYDLRNAKEQGGEEEDPDRLSSSAGGISTMHCLLYREPGRD